MAGKTSKLRRTSQRPIDTTAFAISGLVIFTRHSLLPLDYIRTAQMRL